jgi:hypothetical protein
VRQRIDLSLSTADGITIDEQDRQVPFYAPNFDFEEPPEQETPLEIAADMLAKLLAEIVPAQGPINLSLIGQKILAVTFLMNRNGTATLTAIAGRAGVSKQLLDHHVNKIGDKLGFHGANQKRAECRAVYAESARERWAALTPEQRRARRRGKAAQQATPI